MHKLPALGRVRAPHSRLTLGQAVVEFAIVLPILLLIMLFTIDFGRAFAAWVNLNNLVRIGANYAAQNPQAWQGTGIATFQSEYQQLMLNDAEGMNCTLPSTLPAPTFPAASPNTYDLGSPAQVDLTCKFSLLTPFIGAIIGDANQQISMSASAAFPIRSGSVNGIAVAPPGPPAASISLTKSANPTSFSSAGDVIQYSYLVTNTGTVDLSGDVTVTDNKATVTCPPGGLLAQATTTCTASYTVTSADVTAGAVTNTATAYENGYASNTSSVTVHKASSATASFYGTPAEAGYDPTTQLGPHSQWGGPGSTYVWVAWNYDVPISWTNTSTGASTCSWVFGSGTSPTTSTSCSPSPSIYTTAGAYTVTLTVNGSSTANYTVLATCQVPDFHGTDPSAAQATWNAAGFTTTVKITGNGSTVLTQDLSSGLLNPSGDGCGAQIKLGTK